MLLFSNLTSIQQGDDDEGPKDHPAVDTPTRAPNLGKKLPTPKVHTPMKILKGFVDTKLLAYFPHGTQSVPEKLWTLKDQDRVWYSRLVQDLTYAYDSSTEQSFAINTVTPGAIAHYMNKLCDIHTKTTAKALKDKQTEPGETTTANALLDKPAGEPRVLIGPFAKASRTTKQANRFK